jgi:hypothetical protein
MILAVADQAEVEERGNDDCYEVDTIDGMAAVDYPSVNNCCERQEQEPQYKEQQRVIGALQEVREKKQENDDEARERDRQQSNQAAPHGPSHLVDAATCVLFRASRNSIPFWGHSWARSWLWLLLTLAGTPPRNAWRAQNLAYW